MPGKKAHKPKKAEQHFTLRLDMESVYQLRRKVDAITYMGDPAKRPKVLPRPGDGYAPGARIMLTCPVCGRKKLIAPRMHAYWLRDREGRIHFVCGEVCTAQSGPYAPINLRKVL